MTMAGQAECLQRQNRSAVTHSRTATLEVALFGYLAIITIPLHWSIGRCSRVRRESDSSVGSPGPTDDGSVHGQSVAEAKAASSGHHYDLRFVAQRVSNVSMCRLFVLRERKFRR
ncbi:hypothetical protein J6590_080621 [Homalodisca vitripennis]|nr:hypothetical protein J6590_080621 [Homalodisca vitripennis]